VTTQSGDFKAEDTRWDRMACVEATHGAVSGHPSDGEDMKTSKSSLEGLVTLVIRKGHFRLGCLYITQEVRGWQPTLGTLAHLFSYFPSYFP
jgi:hypothetical protein